MPGARGRAGAYALKPRSPPPSRRCRVGSRARPPRTCLPRRGASPSEFLIEASSPFYAQADVQKLLAEELEAERSAEEEAEEAQGWGSAALRPDSDQTQVF